MNVSIGIDIGGTKCAPSVGACTPDEVRILHREEFPTKGKSWLEVLEAFGKRMDRLLTSGRETASPFSIANIGISCGGPLDSRRGGILTAFANDVAWETAFAQQVYGLGRRGDVLIALSTSGNSANCVNAALVARARGVKVIALTGADGGKLAELADAAIRVPETETYKVQELHLPVYHALCAALEAELFGEEN